jgi:type-F conjugative transfer system secretin TraK
MNFKILPFLLLGTAVDAAILKPLDDLNVIEVSIAREDLTRIAVKEDRILNVVGLTGEYVLEADETQGQVFIRPNEHGPSKPINLTLITEEGHTQDLRLVPQNKSPEALILVSREEQPGNMSFLSETRRHLKGNLLQISVTRNDVEDLLRASQEERIPIGYKLAPINLKGDLRYKGSLEISSRLIRELKGKALRALTYHVENKSKNALVLSEPNFVKDLDFPQNSIVAVLMPKKSLISGERTVVYVVAQSLD